MKRYKKNRKRFVIFSSEISICREAYICMIYGYFAVLCQTVLIFLNVIIVSEANISSRVLSYIYVPYIEYPLMSIAILIGGCALMELAQKDMV